MIQSNIDTQEIRRKDIAHHLHPFTDFSSFKSSSPLVIAAAEGTDIIDSDGNRFLDGIGGLWCVNVGYGRAEIAQTMAEQAARMNYYSAFVSQTNVPAAQLAEKICSLAPRNFNHVFFGLGGSDANDTAVRMIHLHFNILGKKTKKKIITRWDGYHGSTYMGISLTGIAYDHIGFDIVPGDLIHRVSSPNMYRRTEGMTETEWLDFLAKEFETKIQTLGPDNVAAFFAEPIMGAGGVIVAPRGYHRRMRDICRRYQVVYVSDEVVTAFGRLGHFFTSDAVFNIEPDIITCAKGLTSGYFPLSGCLLSDAFYDVISVPQSPGAMFTHGYTYSAHPVGCAVALKNIEIMEREDLCGHVRRVGPYFEKRLAELLDLPMVGDVRGSHFMLCVEMVADKASKRSFEPQEGVGKKVAAACQRRGLLVRPIGDLNILSPPLILTTGQIDRLVSTLRESILEVAEGLKQSGRAIN